MAHKYYNARRRLRNLDKRLGDMNWIFFIPDRRGQPSKYDMSDSYYAGVIRPYQRRAVKLENWWKDISSVFRDDPQAQERMLIVDNDFTALRDALAKPVVIASEVSDRLGDLMRHVRSVNYLSLGGRPEANKYYAA